MFISIAILLTRKYTDLQSWKLMWEPGVCQWPCAGCGLRWLYMSNVCAALQRTACPPFVYAGRKPDYSHAPRASARTAAVNSIAKYAKFCIRQHTPAALQATGGKPCMCFLPTADLLNFILLDSPAWTRFLQRARRKRPSYDFPRRGAAAHCCIYRMFPGSNELLYSPCELVHEGTLAWQASTARHHMPRSKFLP